MVFRARLVLPLGLASIAFNRILFNPIGNDHFVEPMLLIN